ncbi:MAG TPA: PAS domain-containing protein [Aliidongia sp.]|nr:PAS domain-containing protein [Aliidongia sp.]
MSFDALISKLTDPSLIAIARHWRDACGLHAMPGWQDIDPTAIAPYLPMVWAWRFDPAQNTFIGRLAGDRIVSMLGLHSRGKRLEECFAPELVPLIMTRYRRVLDGPSFMRGEGPIYLRIGKQGLGERVVLPLAKDHVHADGILGATIYKLQLPLNQTGGGETDYSREELDFFPLG